MSARTRNAYREALISFCALPALPLTPEAVRLQFAVGTTSANVETPRTLAPTPYKLGQTGSIPGKPASNATKHKFDPISKPVNANDPLTSGVNGSSIRGDKTAIELFVAGVRGWGSWRWREIENGQST
jgi:hypothetical protein